MSVFYYSTKEKRAPGYGCVAGYVDGGATCQMMSSAPVDAAVAELFLAAVTPAQVGAAVAELYPNGIAGVDEGEVVRAVFLRIKRRDSSDNVGR